MEEEEEQGAAAVVPASPIENNILFIAPDFNSFQVKTKTLYKLEDVPNKNIYYKLINIFPHSSYNEIKKLLIHPPFDINMHDESALVSLYVDHLLAIGIANNSFNDENRSPEILNFPQDTDGQYQYLLEIFPNADPTYLYEVSKNCYNDQNAILNFIDNTLQHHNYPTKDDYLERQKLVTQQKQYTSEFNINKFMAMFPDPFTFFENPCKIDRFKQAGFDYLKNAYIKFKVTTIRDIYTRSNFNLSRTAKKLDFLQPDMKSKRIMYETQIPQDDLQLLQEIAFLKNKQTIKDYFSMKLKEEEQEYEECKSKGCLLECQCCFVTNLIPKNTVSCHNGHIFCKSCVKDGTELKMAEDILNIECFIGCGSFFTIFDIQQVLNPTSFNIFIKKKQNYEVKAAEIEGLESCPFCYFASIPPPEDKIFKCLNPECMKETCRFCKQINHLPEKCKKDIEANKARLLIEEKITKVLIRTCCHCKKPFYKENGCNKMKCLCGAVMCYLCNTKIADDYKHFRGQGSERYDLCPLYTDDNKLNAELVHIIVKEMKEEIEKINPEIKVDINGLLPEIPQDSEGYHKTVLTINDDPVTEFIRIRSDAIKKAE